MLCRSPGGDHRGTRIIAKQPAATTKVSASIAIAQPEPNAATSMPAIAKPDDGGGVLGQPAQGDRARQLVGRHGLPGHRLRRRAAEGGEAAVGQPDDAEQGHRRPAADERGGDDALGQRSTGGRALHQHLARQPVAQHAAEHQR